MTTAVAADEYGGMNMPTELKADERMEHHDLQQLVLSCNKEGMDYLRKGQYKQAFEQLKYAEAILVANHKEEEPTSLLAVTCNNLGCYYKKVGKLHASLSYLRKALKIEVSLQTDDVTVAGTHLNICAILSKLDKHDKAVQHASCALELISNRVDSASHAVTQDEYSVLAIAYHNVAVERDYLHQWDQAHSAYQQGHQIAKKCLGEQHPLTQTLAKNCDTALQKSQKFSRERSAPQFAGQGGSPQAANNGQTASVQLPEIGSRRVKDQSSQDDPLPIQTTSVHQEAAEWVQGEETSWTPSRNEMQSYEKSSPGIEQYHRSISSQNVSGSMGGNLSMQGPPIMPREPFSAPSSQWAPSYPKYHNEIPDMPTAVPVAASQSPPPLVMMTQETKRQPREDTIQVGGESVDNFLQGRNKSGAPGQHGKGFVKTTRAQREAERMKRQKTVNSDMGANQVPEEHMKQSKLLKKTAAVKIQRAFRAHSKYMKEHRDRIRRENAAATKLQARWRAFHVRRVRFNGAATCIQRWTRGHLVRKAKKRQHAAEVIQKHTKGMLARKHLNEINKAATALQKVARGKLARKQCKVHEANLMKATLVIQRSMRRWKARKIATSKRLERDAGEARVQATIRIQSVFRGIKGRAKADKCKRVFLAEVEERRAAVRIQSAARRKEAEKKVANLRQVRLQGMNEAATIIQKHYLRSIHQRRYLELRQDFMLHVGSITTMQRYVRGFLVRLRMWRNAIQAEEELWAAVEIQRVWRGYMGRLRWELAYEAVWSREIGAIRLQRYIRGWLARTRVHRMRRKLARAEFEKARRRFKAAQLIQANVRGWIVRRRTAAYRKRIVKEVITIQKCVRGHQLRRKLHHEGLGKRVVQMQSAARGFLVRNRRFHLIANIICIQRHYRMWRKNVPEMERSKRVETRRKGRAAAKMMDS